MGIFSNLFSSGKKENTTETQKNNDKNFDILKYDGIRALQIRKIEYAIRCFTEALNIRQDIDTMNYLASAYVIEQEFDNALEILNGMTELTPDDPNVYLTRVSVLLMADKEAEAIPDCLKVIELDPENNLAYFQMAKAKRTTEDLLGAIADLTKVISLKEDFAEGYLLRAEILYDMKQGKEALEDVNRTIELIPEEETAYLLRGRIHELLGDIQSASDDYQQALDLNPFHEEAYLMKAQLLVAQEKYDEAITVYDEAIEHNEQSAKAYAERGRVKNLKGDDKGAIEDLKISIELNPDSDEAQKVKQANFDDLYKGGIF